MAQNNKNVTPEINEVDQAISKWEKTVIDNKNYIMYGVVAIVVIVASIWGFVQCSDSRNAEAQDAIWQAEQMFDQGQYQEALEGFESVIADFGSTKSGNVAKAYAGLCQKNLGNLEEAVKLLKDFDGKDNVIAPAILSALGDCLVDMENPEYENAAEMFEKAAKAANNAQFTPLFLKKAGLAYEAAGKNESAAKVYQNIKDNWAETSIAQTIDKYIERVK